MTRKEAESYTDNFPPLTAELEREIRKTLPMKYLIIDNGGTAYCTACEEKLYPGEYDSSVKHRQTTFCQAVTKLSLRYTIITIFTARLLSANQMSECFCQTTRPIICTYGFIRLRCFLTLVKLCRILQSMRFSGICSRQIKRSVMVLNTHGRVKTVTMQR